MDGLHVAEMAEASCLAPDGECRRRLAIGLRVCGFRMLAVKNSKTRFAVGASGAKSPGMAIPVADRISASLITTNSCALSWAFNVVNDNLLYFDALNTLSEERRARIRRKLLDSGLPISLRR
jgi:hypothetical protein